MNNREEFEAWAEKELLPLDRRDSDHYRYNLTNRAWAGWQAALASQAQQESKPVVWGYAWQCKSMGDWRIEKLGEGCIPPKDTLALYALPPAPEGDNP